MSILSGQRFVNALFCSYPLNVVSQSVTLNDLFRLVSVDHGLKAIEGSAAHDIADALLLNAEPLNLVIDVEEEGVVSGTVVARTDKKTAWASYSGQDVKIKSCLVHLKDILPSQATK